MKHLLDLSGFQNLTGLFGKFIFYQIKKREPCLKTI